MLGNHFFQNILKINLTNFKKIQFFSNKNNFILTTFIMKQETQISNKFLKVRNFSKNSILKSNELKNKRILITGSCGQIGTELVTLLRKEYGSENVIASDVKMPTENFRKKGPFYYLDVMNFNDFCKIIVDHNINWIIHNSSLLSAAGEQNPTAAMELNIKGLQNALEISKKYNLRIFAPSSIAAFGPSTPKIMTPDLTLMRPTTIYGITKVYLELLGEYYFKKYGVDFRSLRYPGIISSETPPTGGTTDYAVEIFYEALKYEKYTCFLKKDTALPMMYMPDCLKATQQLLEAKSENLSQRVYNVTAFSFTPEQISKEIQKYLPSFTIQYNPDFRQQIADSWPQSLDDSLARKDWNWNNEFDLNKMTKDMLKKLSEKFKQQNPQIKLPSFINID